eukprot:2027449-Rhodomonas_salina.3
MQHVQSVLRIVRGWCEGGSSSRFKEIHPEIQCKKPHLQCKLYQECGFLCLISGGRLQSKPERASAESCSLGWHRLRLEGLRHSGHACAAHDRRRTSRDPPLTPRSARAEQMQLDPSPALL